LSTATRPTAETPAQTLPRADGVDIMLLLEGTFPYVSGGVSSWVNQIIRGFPDIRFGGVFVGSRPEDYGPMRYQLPPNVVHLERHYLHDPAHDPPPRRTASARSALAQMQTLHEAFRQARAVPKDGPVDPDVMGRMLRETIDAMESGAMTEHELLHGEAAWSYITDQYRTFSTDPSFVDYFWTVRIMHAPIWKLARIARSLPPARAYHTISTGYAGFLGALLKVATGRPLLLSEHGIYTKERKIDLFQAEWIRDNRGVFEKDVSQLSYFRDLWIRFFESLGRMCYAAADEIVSLYEANRLRQLADGAPAERTRNIPNGIDLPRLTRVRAARKDGPPPPVLCLIGRVVPIKDVKTFIRAMRTVANERPDAAGWIAGPEDEDPAYARECRAVVEGLGLADKVRFLGFQKIDELLPKVGLLILSSISEALPLVILEGFAAGVPSVSTDVGSCRQLIEGLGDEDRALGSAGAIVRIADPQALARASLDLLGDVARWQAAQTAGVARVERYYTQERMFGAYAELYRSALEAPDRARSKR